MGIREDMETLKFLQQASASRQGNPGQMSPMMQAQMGGMPDEGMQNMQDMQEMQQAMQQQPQQQAQMPPQKPSPLEAGSRSAVEAAKRSLEMNDNENRRALGRALMGMMSGIGQSESYGKGLAGNLGAINAGFSPALSAYDAERDRIMQMNHDLAVQQKQEAMLARKEEQDMKKMSHEMDIANKRLGVEQGYLGLEKQKREDERKEHEEMSKPGAKIPLSSLGKNQWGQAKKEIKDYIDKGEASHHALETIKHVKSILTNDPDITKNMSTIMLAAQRNDPSIVRQKLNSWFIPEKTRADAEMLAKHLSNLYTSKLKGFSPRGMNMFLEKQLREGNLDINMSAPAMIELLDQDEKALKPIYDNAQEVYDEYEKGNFYRPRPQKLSELKEEDKTAVVSGMTDEQKQARIQELLKMREAATE